jgi:hypothetical protein
VFLFEAGAVSLDETTKLFNGRQGQEVARDEELVLHAGGSELDLGLVLVAAQENAYGRIVAFAPHTLLEEVQVVVHLARVRVLEGADLQIEQDMASQMAVEAGAWTNCP